MPVKGTCLLSYLPMRSEPRSGSEMVSMLIFGESFEVYSEENDFLKIKTDFDNYEGWISKNSFSEFMEFDSVTDELFVLAKSGNEKIFIPCGANMPSIGGFKKDGKDFKIDSVLKTNHHLPIKLRITKTAQIFLNTPYLWGGRSFMGIDCSGFVQIVFKANGINLPRDTSQQILEGKNIDFHELKPCDLVFFSKINSNKVSHVGMMLDSNTLIHSSGNVKLQAITDRGLYNVKGELDYQLMACRSLLD